MSKTPGKHQKIIILLIFLITLGPFGFAYTLYKKGNKAQLKLNNHGDLITPVINVEKNQAISGEQLLGKWWLVYVGPKNCRLECHDMLYNLKQIRTALGKDTPRVERLFIAHPNCDKSVCETFISDNYPDMKRITMPLADFNQLFAGLSQHFEREMVGEVYIIDPKGNLMMRYSADSQARDILSDVKRLLRTSKIG
ncbi:SCO family protein [Candidatus Berkiella aquae]|uniref:SCO family protein n=1 Tax=Candidatus Berkiella aquae TaxID=295108 RepID=A0A0Q9YJX3_9GAMM|nr:SCO family protein [Candidatus Berkiella aquae]MCS5710080.1 SCO family protein [Candidatus Berkiella aquae]